MARTLLLRTTCFPPFLGSGVWITPARAQACCHRPVTLNRLRCGSREYSQPNHASIIAL